jgi:hypothetical protein
VPDESLNHHAWKDLDLRYRQHVSSGIVEDLLAVMSQQISSMDEVHEL